MALKPDLIEFFLRNIQSASVDTFGSEVAQLFGHLDSEIKDNPVFNKYEEARINWEDQSTKQYRSWKFPTNSEYAKSFVYNLYRTVGESDRAAVDLPMKMTHVNHGDLSLLTKR